MRDSEQLFWPQAGGLASCQQPLSTSQAGAKHFVMMSVTYRATKCRRASDRLLGLIRCSRSSTRASCLLVTDTALSPPVSALAGLPEPVCAEAVGAIYVLRGPQPYKNSVQGPAWREAPSRQGPTQMLDPAVTSTASLVCTPQRADSFRATATDCHGSQALCWSWIEVNAVWDRPAVTGIATLVLCSAQTSQMRRQACRALWQISQRSQTAPEACSLPAGTRWMASESARGTTVLCVRKDQQVAGAAC